MASLVKYGRGCRRIEFRMQPNEQPRIVRLGKMNAKAAQGVRDRVERIVADKLLNRAHDPDLADWLGNLEDWLLQRFKNAGLADGVGLTTTTVGDFLERYFAALSVKPATRTFYEHIKRNLEEHFGTGKLLREIRPADADAFRTWLVEHEGLAAATVARRIGAARTIWRTAIRWKLATENVFAGVRAGHQENEARKRFVPRETIKRVIDAAPDAEWRALIALARFGGLRVPSEPFALRWGDVDWAEGTIRVTCPKLAHKANFARRLVPLFPEIRGALMDLFELAEEGAEYVFPRLRLSKNVAVHFRKIIRRANVEVWPKPFHNLRASRQTELMRSYDLATVCRWLGNSPKVAAAHYATSVDLDADFQRAIAGEAEEAQRKAQCFAQKATPGDSRQRAADRPRKGRQGSRKPLKSKAKVAGGDKLSPGGDSGRKADKWAILDLNQ